MTFLQYRLVIPLWKAKSMCIMGAPTNHTPTNRPHTQHPYSNRPRHYPYLHNWSPKNPSLSHTIPCLNGDDLYQGRSVRGRFRKGRFFLRETVCAAPDPTCLGPTSEQLAHICRLPKYPCIKAYPNIVVLARKYNLNNFVCFRFTSLEHGNTVYNANILHSFSFYKI